MQSKFRRESTISAIAAAMPPSPEPVNPAAASPAAAEPIASDTLSDAEVKQMQSLRRSLAKNRDSGQCSAEQIAKVTKLIGDLDAALMASAAARTYNSQEIAGFRAALTKALSKLTLADSDGKRADIKASIALYNAILANAPAPTRRESTTSNRHVAAFAAHRTTLIKSGKSQKLVSLYDRAIAALSS